MSKARRPKRPFNQGDLVEGRVMTLSRKGGALAEVAGAEVRVMGGVPGDIAELKIVHTGKHINVAQLQSLKTPSSARVEAPCSVFMSCGGCPWQSTNQALQRDTRAEGVRALLKPLMGPETRDHGWVGPEAAVGYRTRALVVTRHRAGSLRMGFYAPGTQELVPIDTCPVQHPRVNSVLRHAHRILARLDWPTWRSAERPGVLRGLLYRVDPSRDEGILTLILSVEPGPKVAEAAERLIRIDGVCAVHANVNLSASGPLLGPRTLRLKGKRRQTLDYGGMALEVSPASFTQTRHDMAEAMVETLGSFLPDQIGHLVDLYAGAGLLGLAFRERCERVTLIENHPSASSDAAHNARRLDDSRVSVLAEDAATAGPRALEGGADVVICDPPRAGCSPALIDAILALSGEVTLLYASCEPRTLSRDLTRLVEGGFELQDVALFDMFPHTPHVEVGVALRRGA